MPPLSTAALRYNGRSRSRILVSFHRLARGWFSPAAHKKGFQSLALNPCRSPARLLVPVIALRCYCSRKTGTLQVASEIASCSFSWGDRRPPLPRKQPRRQRAPPLKHAARPTESRNQNPQQRRADPPDGERSLVHDRVQVARPHRRGHASRRARRRRSKKPAGRCAPAGLGKCCRGLSAP